MCKESLLPTEGNVILKPAEVNHIEPSASFLFLFSYSCLQKDAIVTNRKKCKQMLALIAVKS